jgi:hypothetical protein
MVVEMIDVRPVGSNFTASGAERPSSHVIIHSKLVIVSYKLQGHVCC